MSPHTLTFDKIQEMIKKKILIKQSPIKQYTNRKKESTLKFRPKQFRKSPFRKNSQNLNNNIIIMNMPTTSKIDFIKENLKNNPLVIRKLSHNQGSNPHIFSNQKIFNGLQSLNTVNECHQLHNNFMNQKKQTFMELKRSNSLDARPLMNDINNQSPQHASINFFRSLNPTFKESTKNLKLSVASIDFNPSLRGLLSRRNKTQIKSEGKMHKIEFNYQRAISSSSESRKKAFQKVLDTFQSNLSSKTQNFELQNNKIEESEKLNFERVKTPREISTSSKTRIGSPQRKKRKEDIQEQTCRPWSAGKKAQTKFQTSEEQNPLQFYSINDNQ